MNEGFKMKSSAKEILDRALEMPENDRAAIAERLLASLDAKPDQNVEEAWQQEVQHRLSELDRSEVECVPWEEVRARLGKK
ncbi:MAG: addiction module protein [Acidiferrobacterales bacterium]